MSKLFKIVVSALAVILLGTANSTSAQTKKQREKIKTTQSRVSIEYPIEYPADPDDPFYKMTVELPTVDKVEMIYITHLRKDQMPDDQTKAGETGQVLNGGIPGERFKIAAQNVLIGKDAEDFAAQWRKLLRGPGAGCFAPAYRITFWSKDRILLETNVCYHCRNLIIPGNGIRGFNAEGNSGKELLKRLKELLPESDTDRNRH
jgi:hypothetical protein